MIGEVIGEIAGGALRIVGRIFGEVVFHVIGEVVIQGTGYLICRLFTRDVDAEGWLVTFVGLAFWAGMVAMLYLIFSS